MSQFTSEQLASALAALGISPASDATTIHEASVMPKSPATRSLSTVEGHLQSFYCFNCSFPNVVPVIAIPASVQPSHHSPAVASHAHGLMVTAASIIPLPQPPVTPAPAALPTTESADMVSTPTLPPPSTPPVASGSMPAATDGPWYTVSKGLSIGVFKGWQTVRPLVTGVGHACYFHHVSQAAASEAFNEALTMGTVEVLH
ncbi:hypothetical protein ARMGADRAFT_1029955 [Armillaria gallica]|uniref:Ribonuclease H1 N-terminal domain-containing protein n=1 Tax=Armillaria gallica TaxID=47427 RepID=A0A2H3E387_ARMGA|nr:hypothetical protein ARMGADRAFT_1029955 [Armillaria gallica]